MCIHIYVCVCESYVYIRLRDVSVQQLFHVLFHTQMCMCRVCSVRSTSLQAHGLQPTRLLCPWNFPGNNTGMGYHFLLQGVFLTQRSNLHLLHLQVNSFRLSHLENSLFFLIHPAIPKVNLKKKKRERERKHLFIDINLFTYSIIYHLSYA